MTNYGAVILIPGQKRCEEAGADMNRGREREVGWSHTWDVCDSASWDRPWVSRW